MLQYKVFAIGTSEAIKQDVITTPLAELYPNDRRALALGPTITIKVGNIACKDLLKRAAMALA
jgi:hypothetical protein